ncbi:MAG TPA: ribosome silencing factor [Clostridia bacterium]|nr:ribosome silencing factor [Clostridia bacterium]
MIEQKELANRICKVLDNKLAKDVTVIDVSKLTILTNNLIICTGRSPIHVKTLANELVKEMEKLGHKVLRTDGYPESRWIVLDFGDSIVHIFNEEERKFYNLEKLWSNGMNAVRYSEL